MKTQRSHRMSWPTKMTKTNCFLILSISDPYHYPSNKRPARLIAEIRCVMPHPCNIYRLTTILPSLVVIVKGSVDIWTKLLTGGQKLASSLRMDLDGE